MDEDVEHTLQPPPSHLSQVPNEILAQIFTAGTEEWRDLDPGGLPFPMLVSAVCKYWRMLSHSTQNLWTFIVPPLKKQPAKSLRWTSEWIKRSGAMAISVILDDTPSFSPSVIARGDAVDPEALAIMILSLILTSTHRLHRIDICLQNISLPIMKAMEHISSTRPPLREISIRSTLRAHPSYLTFSSSTDFSWLQSLPNLRKFRFQDSSYRPATLPGMNNRCALPYISNLVSLDLSHLRLTHSELEILFAPSHCRLQTLVLRHLHPNGSAVPEDFSPIEVNTLRTIALSTAVNYRGDHGTSLFASLVIPNLTYLEIDSDIPISILFGNSLSASKVETLKISSRLPLSSPHKEERHKEDMNIFRSFSSIQTLELIELHSSAKFLLSGLLNEKGMKMTRKRSVNCPQRPFDDAGGPDIAVPELGSNILWPNLRSITLDTITPGDVKSLIDFTKRHKNVQEISLSPSAMRSLADLERRGDEIVLPTPTLYKYREGMINADELATNDVSEWLGKRVKLVQSKRSNVDLLLWERSDRAPSSSRRLSSG